MNALKLGLCHDAAFFLLLNPPSKDYQIVPAETPHDYSTISGWAFIDPKQVNALYKWKEKLWLMIGKSIFEVSDKLSTERIALGSPFVFSIRSAGKLVETFEYTLPPLNENILPF